MAAVDASETSLYVRDNIMIGTKMTPTPTGTPNPGAVRSIRPVFGRIAPSTQVQQAPSRVSPASQTRRATAITPKRLLSDEQLSVVRSTAGVCVVNAFAGTGKTTTAQAVAEAYPNERFLYLSLTKANQTEAASRFPSNVKPMTTHAVALSQVGASLGSRDRVVQQWRALTVRQEMQLPTTRRAALTQTVLNEFFKSEDREISEDHTFEIATNWKATEAEILASVSHAKDAWSKMGDRTSKVSIPPDAYLKMFALSNPRLPFDRIIFDEAQDSNPVTAQIIHQQSSQNSARILCIGDRHQSIYGFRGSIDAMTDFASMGGAEVLHLTKTWRFGQEIADLANILLNELKGEKTRIIGAGTPGPWNASRYTHLARTNSQLISIAASRSGKGIHWVGGPDSYRLSTLEDAYHLFSREPQKIQDRFYQNFPSWHAYEEYATNSRDSDARVILKIIGEPPHDPPDLLRDIRANAVANQDEAELTLSTGHKAKGLDWDCVQIGDDFEFLQEIEKFFIDHPGQPLSDEMVQEVDLLYVAITRARKSLTLNAETRDWFTNLASHQLTRMSAARIHHFAIEKARRK